MKNLIFSLFAVYSFLIFPVVSSGQDNKTSPNIIFILTDDQRSDALGYAGNPIIHTPNMDQLAREGIYFENAFVTTPICAASRASIATGLYERTHRFTFDTPPLDRKLVDISYYKLLKDAGYHTGFIGKFGMQFEEKADTALFNVYDAYMPNFYYRLTGKAWGKHSYLTYLTGEKASDFIERAPAGKPFCLNISFNAPHAEDRSPDQYIYPDNLASLYENHTIPDPPLSDEKYFKAQPQFVREGLNRIRWYWRFDTREKYQRMVKGYYRMITAVDEVLGTIRQTLKRKGIEDETIIIFTSDNGYFLNERNLAGKWLMYENSIRVPLILYDPVNAMPPSHREELALNIDIAPTILEYAGIKIPDHMQGKSLVPVVKQDYSGWRTEFFIEHLFDHDYIPKSEGIRTKEWKFFRYIDHPGYEELYKLKEDSLEINDLSDNPAYGQQFIDLEHACDSWIDKLNRARAAMVE